MSGLSFIVTMDSGAVERTIGDLVNRLTNPQKAFRKIADFLSGRIKDHFFSQQGHTEKWERLSSSTIKSRTKSDERLIAQEKRNFSQGKIKREETLLRRIEKIKSINANADIKPLVNIGTLQASLSKGGDGNVYEITDTYCKVGTTIPYAKYHQHPRFPDAPTNSLNASKKVPKRDFIYVSTKEKEQLKEIIKRYLGGTLS